MEEMKKKGANVYLMVPYRDKSFLLPFRMKGIKVILYKYSWWMKEKGNVKLSKYFTTFFGNYITAFRVAKRIKEFNIDIIHTNSSVSNIGGLISKLTGIPHVWHIREFGKEDYNLDFLYGEKYAMKFMDKYSSQIIAISNAIYEKYKDYFGNKLIVVYNGISKNYINTKQGGVEKDPINLLLAGSIMPGKGQLDAVMAVKHIIDSGYTNIHLNIAGSIKNKEYYDKIKKVVDENKLHKNIDFVGYQDDLKALRQAANIELVCSKSEAFGRVTVEAMLSENPVIGADSGGTKELIINGYNGLLYKSNDYIDLAEKIKYFIDNKEKMCIMGKNAYNYALNNFTAERNAEELYNIYCKLLG
jgi:glycosyltransferase involved in cell wall biosynthesis